MKIPGVSGGSSPSTGGVLSDAVKRANDAMQTAAMTETSSGGTYPAASSGSWHGNSKSDYRYTGSATSLFQRWVAGDISTYAFQSRTAKGDGTSALVLDSSGSGSTTFDPDTQSLGTTSLGGDTTVDNSGDTLQDEISRGDTDVEVTDSDPSSSSPSGGSGENAAVDRFTGAPDGTAEALRAVGVDPLSFSQDVSDAILDSVREGADPLAFASRNSLRTWARSRVEDVKEKLGGSPKLLLALAGGAVVLVAGAFGAGGGE